jgi:hypothetical protein
MATSIRFISAIIFIPVFLLGYKKASRGLSIENDLLVTKYRTAKAPDPAIRVPLGGNAFVTQPVPGGTEKITDKGLTNWTNPNAVISTYFRLGQTGKLSISIRAKVPTGTSTIKIFANGMAFTKTLTGNNYTSYVIGDINITNAGYVKIDLKGISKTGNYFADVSDIIINGTSTISNVIFANDSLNFYWSRRGPSVHLLYTAPENTEWFYNEVTVPVGEDKIGSYFMSNGFDGGYFGIQVNSATERRVLFSVWDPEVGKTTLVRKGPGVVDNAFGGEGTGGQSYMLFNWQEGKTYKFLTQGKPDGQGNTLYSSWLLASEWGAWRFIATWKRPNTNSYLTGIYSFLENFEDEKGWQGRKAFYNNQWTRTASGTWTELINAQLTADATAHNGQRKDYAGGVENGQFFLKNCGFFSQFVNYDTPFTRKATGKMPVIDLKKLP